MSLQLHKQSEMFANKVTHTPGNILKANKFLEIRWVSFLLGG